MRRWWCSSYAMRELAAELTGMMPTCRLRLMMDGTIPGWDQLRSADGGGTPLRVWPMNGWAPR